ncbi:unnamed protein product [Owenia fusiformis]|uniref:Uncharacterized protein n=1 Tax=Owenia fusiformis TaxID=6347 RepID=A0A8J1UWC9_OWEFU|nr:unnamed protein product [Owenia fusiformis]
MMELSIETQDKTVESYIKLFTLNEVADHWEYNDCWIVLRDRVYDITPFLKEHPGGEDVILENAGRDVTVAFYDKGHSKDAVEMLGQYCIGMLIESERIYSRPTLCRKEKAT